MALIGGTTEPLRELTLKKFESIRRQRAREAAVWGDKVRGPRTEIAPSPFHLLFFFSRTRPCATRFTPRSSLWKGVGAAVFRDSNPGAAHAWFLPSAQPNRSVFLCQESSRGGDPMEVARSRSFQSSRRDNNANRRSRICMWEGKLSKRT